MYLRAIEEGDLRDILSWRNAPEVRKNMYTHHEISWVEHNAWFKSLKNNHRSLWYLFEDESHRPQGVIYINDYDPQQGNAFWGFYSSPNAPIGTGICMEYIALNHIFSTLKLHKLNCEVLATNKKVINLHKKVGFTVEGIFRDYHFNGNEYVDVVRLGITCSEWDSSKENLLNRIKSLSGD